MRYNVQILKTVTVTKPNLKKHDRTIGWRRWTWASKHAEMLRDVDDMFPEARVIACNVQTSTLILDTNNNEY